MQWTCLLVWKQICTVCLWKNPWSFYSKWSCPSLWHFFDSRFLLNKVQPLWDLKSNKIEPSKNCDDVTGKSFQKGYIVLPTCPHYKQWTWDTLCKFSLLAMDTPCTSINGWWISGNAWCYYMILTIIWKCQDWYRTDQMPGQSDIPAFKKHFKKVYAVNLFFNLETNMYCTSLEKSLIFLLKIWSCPSLWHFSDSRFFLNKVQPLWD